MFQLLKIQYTLKLRRRSASSSLGEVSILLDIITSPIPFLMELLQSKKNLPKILYKFKDVLPLHWYCLKCQSIWTSEGTSHMAWELGRSMYCIQELMQPIEAHESSSIITKWLLSTLLFSSLLQITRHLLFANPFNWDTLMVMCQKSCNQPRLNKTKWKLCWRCLQSLILSLLTTMLSTPQADYYWDTTKNCPTINLMVVHCFIMLLLVLSGLKIKSLMELEKHWWIRNPLNNRYRYWLLLKFATCIVTMEFSMLNSMFRTARTSFRLSHFLELVLIIRMPLLNNKFKLSCTKPRPLWFIFLCTGDSMVLIILHFRVLLWNVQFDFTIAFQPSLLTNINGVTHQD